MDVSPSGLDSRLVVVVVMVMVMAVDKPDGRSKAGA